MFQAVKTLAPVCPHCGAQGFAYSSLKCYRGSGFYAGECQSCLERVVLNVDIIRVLRADAWGIGVDSRLVSFNDETLEFFVYTAEALGT